MTDTHAPMPPSKLQNYNSARGAAAYKSDHQHKLHRRFTDRRERALLARYFARIGVCSQVLDLPCGHGRMADLLSARCRTLLEADWSFSMVRLNQADHRQAGNRRYLRCSALEIPLPERSVDCAVSLRLSHHLQTQELRERHLRELFRVADRAVIVTWFSPTSLKNVLRALRVRFFGKQPKNTVRNDRVRAIAGECGFVQRAARPLL